MAVKQMLVTYEVTGIGGFPMDMLRYDSAWPADSDGADAIWENIFYHDREKRDGVKPIRLRSYQQPTVDRWRSFGWSVKVTK